MSSEVASARAKMEEEQSHQAVPPIISEAGKDLVAEGAPSGKEIDGPYARETGENKDVANSHCADTKAGDKSKKQETKSSRRGITNREAYKRVSNRVLSKMMTSEKRTERKAKQSSVEYCLLAGVLSCTSENPYYDMLLKADFIWEDLPVLEKLIQKSPSALRAERTKSQLPTRAIQANTILAPSSLRTFAKTWSRNNSGPRPFLESFLVHVSFHCTEIFIHEKNETFASCITDCKLFYRVLVSHNIYQRSTSFLTLFNFFSKALMWLLVMLEDAWNPCLRGMVKGHLKTCMGM